MPLARRPSVIFPAENSARSIIFPGLGFSGTPVEQRSLLYFRTRTVVALSGYFDSDFWDKLVLQVSDTKPTVRHAILALGSIHESIELKGQFQFDKNDAAHQFALQEYNKAVALTVDQMTAINSAQCEVTLIVCILFMCLELFQNNRGAAIDHMRYGLRIFSLCYNQPPLDEARPAGPVLHGSLSPPKRSLRQVFTRFVIQAIFTGGPYHEGPVISPDLDTSLKPFTNITEARESLDDLFVCIFLFLRSLNNGVPDVEHLQPEKNTTLLFKWHKFFLDFIGSQRHTFTPRDSTAAAILEMHHTSLSIILTTTLSSRPSALESLTPSFARIISLAEPILDPSLPNPSSLTSQISIIAPSLRSRSPVSTFRNCSFDMGVIQPLYYTAIRCRSSPLRWRAIALLRLTPPYEGIWGAAMTANLAQRIVEVEEAAASGGALLQQSEELARSILDEIMFGGAGQEGQTTTPIEYETMVEVRQKDEEEEEISRPLAAVGGASSSGANDERLINMPVGRSKRDVEGG